MIMSKLGDPMSLGGRMVSGPATAIACRNRMLGAVSRFVLIAMVSALQTQAAIRFYFDRARLPRYLKGCGLGSDPDSFAELNVLPSVHQVFSSQAQGLTTLA